jgi:hypothetical protein
MDLSTDDSDFKHISEQDSSNEFNPEVRANL